MIWIQFIKRSFFFIKDKHEVCIQYIDKTNYLWIHRNSNRTKTLGHIDKIDRDKFGLIVQLWSYYSKWGSVLGVYYGCWYCNSCNGCVYTVAVDKVGQVEIQLSDWDVYMIRIDAEAWVKAFGRLF